jgi:hypothetical protein
MVCAKLRSLAVIIGAAGNSRGPQIKEAHMRRYVGFGVVIAVVALGIVFWAKSSVVETNANVVRSSAGISPYEIMTNSKNLPVQHIENPM